MSEPLDPTLDNCGCCEPDPVPPVIYNRPGLPALSYRAGTYGTIFRRMLNRIGKFTLQDGDFAGTRPLASLTTREQDDPSVALLDASAVMADVLTFYQERIANEGFLRTATERRSILEMAREIGYELSPGVAASVYLSFFVDDTEGAPGVAEVPAGTKVQSIPPQGKLPQTFETSDVLTTHKEWNAIRPRLSQAQNLLTGISEIYLRGTGNNIKKGDVIMVTSGVYNAAARVGAVEIDSARGSTRLTLKTAIPSLGGAATSVSVTVWGDQKIPFDQTTIQQNILQKTWDDAELNAFLQANEWDAQELVDYLALYRSNNPSVTGAAYTFRSRAGIFGNNAIKYSALPVGQRFGEWVYTDPDSSSTKQFKTAAYPNSWEDCLITTDSQGGALTGASFYLERSLTSLVAGGFAVLENAAGFGVYPVTGVVEKSLSDFGISAKVSGLSVSVPFDSPALTSFKVRETTAHVESEQLTPSEKPLTANLAAGTDEIELDGFVFGLRIGQAVVLSGERADADGDIQSEVLVIKAITHNYGLTTLLFEAGLAHPYKRETTTLNANTVHATHGETVNEILGSGDGALTHQKFTLKKPPLTHIPAETPGGSASTLQLRVNKLLWKQADSLYELDSRDERYIVRIDDDGKASVILGDGIKGARLPTGENNVTATYRSGIGLEGQVDAGSLTLLPIKPFGIRGVSNSLSAGGAGEPEKMEGARSNAPLTVRTLDRVVSREDYGDFANAFAGIGKAQAVDLWSGEYHLVHITIAGEDGKPVVPGPFRDNFIKALDAVRDPCQRMKVDTFELLPFNLEAKISVDERYITEDVFAEVQAALEEAFAFEQRTFGQPVTAAEVITVIQKVEGVLYVDLDALYLSSDSPSLNQILLSAVAHVKDGAIHNARLLLLNPFGVELQEVTA